MENVLCAFYVNDYRSNQIFQVQPMPAEYHFTADSSNCSAFVQNLQADMDWDHVMAIFRPHGAVEVRYLHTISSYMDNS